LFVRATSISSFLHLSAGPRRALTGLARIDHYAQQLLQAAPANTLLLVVTQGNFKAMRQLASRKLRYVAFHHLFYVLFECLGVYERFIRNATRISEFIKLLLPFVLLASHRNRWEQAALKRKQSLVGLGRVYWDASLDESRLIAAAAHATAGAVFLTKK